MDMGFAVLLVGVSATIGAAAAWWVASRMQPPEQSKPTAAEIALLMSEREFMMSAIRYYGSGFGLDLSSKDMLQDGRHDMPHLKILNIKTMANIKSAFIVHISEFKKLQSENEIMKNENMKLSAANKKLLIDLSIARDEIEASIQVVNQFNMICETFKSRDAITVEDQRAIKLTE